MIPPHKLRTWKIPFKKKVNSTTFIWQILWFAEILQFFSAVCKIWNKILQILRYSVGNLKELWAMFATSAVNGNFHPQILFYFLMPTSVLSLIENAHITTMCGISLLKKLACSANSVLLCTRITDMPTWRDPNQ